MKASGNISFQIAEDLDEVDVFLNIFLPLLFKLFFATAITKNLNSLKISQLQKSQIIVFAIEVLGAEELKV